MSLKGGDKITYALLATAARLEVSVCSLLLRISCLQIICIKMAMLSYVGDSVQSLEDKVKRCSFFERMWHPCVVQGEVALWDLTQKTSGSVRNVLVLGDSPSS